MHFRRHQGIFLSGGETPQLFPIDAECVRGRVLKLPRIRHRLIVGRSKSDISGRLGFVLIAHDAPGHEFQQSMQPLGIFIHIQHEILHPPQFPEIVRDIRGPVAAGRPAHKIHRNDIPDKLPHPRQFFCCRRFVDKVARSPHFCNILKVFDRIIAFVGAFHPFPAVFGVMHRGFDAPARAAGFIYAPDRIPRFKNIIILEGGPEQFSLEKSLQFPTYFIAGFESGLRHFIPRIGPDVDQRISQHEAVLVFPIRALPVFRRRIGEFRIPQGKFTDHIPVFGIHILLSP
ncbi:hypothetical protein SDC9_110088 [bioreactor metagenome]|uniref:Uncharacterized protein n=1 Tax=bioreactor metagenome TaxID=1076179 RepID=A0A645BDT0_9ZZZZ